MQTLSLSGRLFRAVRKGEEPIHALAAVGLEAATVFSARTPVLPGFTAEASALARDLARRVGRVAGAIPGSSEQMQPPFARDGRDTPLDPQTIAARSDSARETDDPPSPRLRAEALLAIAGTSGIPEPWGRPCDWEDAEGPASLHQLRMVTRIIRDAGSADAPTARVVGRTHDQRQADQIRTSAGMVHVKSAAWPADVWVGASGRLLCRRLARELTLAEQVAGFSMAEIINEVQASRPRASTEESPAETYCHAGPLCAGPDLLGGYLLDERGHWWCDVCWDALKAARAVATTTDSSSRLRLSFTLDTFHTTPHFQTFAHFLRETRRLQVAVRDPSVDGGFLVGSVPVLAYLSRWLLPTAPEGDALSDTLIEGRRKAWADHLEETTVIEPVRDGDDEAAVDVASTVERCRVRQLPSTVEDLQDIMRLAFTMAPAAMTQGLYVGDWFRLVRVLVRPRGRWEEGRLARLWHLALPLLDDYGITQDMARPRHSRRNTAQSLTSPAHPARPTGVSSDVHLGCPSEARHATPANADVEMEADLSGTAPQRMGASSSTSAAKGVAPPPTIPLIDATPPMGLRVLRPGGLMWEGQQAAQCAVHALNNILQGAYPPFTEEHLREGARLARAADVQQCMLPAHAVHPREFLGLGRHEDAAGNYSYLAVGRALGRRQFDWRLVRPQFGPAGLVDAVATVAAAFAPEPLIMGPKPMLGVFVHLGHHYTAMIRRNDTIYHIDSLRGVSSNGAYVFTISPALFATYAQHFVLGSRAASGHEIGGLFSVYYAAEDLMED